MYLLLCKKSVHEKTHTQKQKEHKNKSVPCLLNQKQHINTLRGPRSAFQASKNTVPNYNLLLFTEYVFTNKNQNDKTQNKSVLRSPLLELQRACTKERIQHPKNSKLPSEYERHLTQKPQ